MRLLCTLALLALPVTAFAEGAPTTPHSAAILLRLHPAPWRPPGGAAVATAGMRYEPDASGAAPLVAPATGTYARAQAEAGVRVSADGTRHAVLAGAIRSYTVVRIDESGRLVGDCVDSEAEAVRRVRAAEAAASPAGAVKREDR